VENKKGIKFPSKDGELNTCPIRPKREIIKTK